MKEKEKTFEKFEKKLKNKINLTSTAKGWSDLLPLMKDLLSILKKYNDFDFNELSDKRLLSKRLAQALNPECPSGLHEIALEVYEVILKNIMNRHNNMLMDNLYLYAYGLFPFFPNASMQNKKKIIDDIVYPIFLKLNREELKLCLPGLLSSLIPGLDDNNDQTTQLIYKTFDSLISQNNGQMERDFYGVYWMLLLRCQHLRTSGIKYLLEKNTKYEEFIKLEEDKKKEIIEKQYPNINTTVVNSLCEIVKDKDIPTVRNGMDFILSRLPLTKEKNMINDDAKINLIISVLNLLIKNEYSTIRRLKCWILGIANEDDEIFYNSEDMKYRMNLVIKAFKIIFSSDENLIEEKLSNNIKIIQRLISTQQEFINLILPDLALPILKCVVNFWKIQLDSLETEDNNTIIKQFKELFVKNQKCCECLWASLANNIKELSEKEIISDKKVNEAIEPLKFCLIYFEMNSNDERIKYYLPIITNLLNVIKKFSTEREKLKEIKKIILITLGFVKSLQESKFHLKKSNNKDEVENKDLEFEIYDKVKADNNEDELLLRPSIISELNKPLNNYGNVYNICEESSLTYILKNNKFNQLINQLSEAILQFQEYYINILLEYSKLDSQVTKFEILIFSQFTELNIRLQEYSQQKEENIKWIKYLEKIIFDLDFNNIFLSIEAANIFLDLNLSSSLQSETFLNIKQNFKNQEIDRNIITSKDIEGIKTKMKVQQNCYELLLGKFYLLSSVQNIQTMTMELLLKMHYIDKIKFIQIINNSFEVNEESIENIGLFTNYWKLANEYYSADENIFLEDECILKMVDLLDNKSPVLRHLSKTWLNLDNQCYDKIIQPILRILLEQQRIFEQKKDEKEYDISKILDSFTKLKNIILNCQIMQFLREKKPKQKLILMITNNNFPENELFYLQTLICISLHYTSVKSKEISDEKYKKDILPVNVSSCEFLEFLFNSIDNKQFLIDNISAIKNTIIYLLQESLKDNNKQEVMRAQLLDLLKALYFRYPLSLIKEPKNKEIFLTILNDGCLINNLINGMRNNQFYIREHFLSFTLKLIETFISIITIEDKKQLQDFYNLCNRFIKPLSLYMFSTLKINNNEKKDTEKFSHYDSKYNNIIFKNYCEEYKEYKQYDESEVLSILKTIKEIIRYCFKNEILEKSNQSGSKQNVKLFTIQIPFIKKKAIKSKSNINIKQERDWVLYKKDLVNNLKTDNPFVSFLTTVTTVIIDYTDKNPNKEIADMPTNLYENQISILLNSFLCVWINQSDNYELYDYCLNSNGILAPVINDQKKNPFEGQINKIIEDINQNPIKKYILQIAMNLFDTDSIKFIENIIELWCSDNSSNLRGKDFNFNDKLYKLSIIELLIAMNIPLDIILFCIGVVLQNKIKKEIYKKIDKNYSTPIKNSIDEAKYFHFIYSYLQLNPKKYSKEDNEDDLIEIWKELITIFNNSISNTKILYSFCWMYEILHLSSQKFDMQNLDKEIKMNIENIFSTITSKLMDVVFSNRFDSKYINKDELVVPVLPHIYTNIVNCLFKEDNLYTKNVEGTTINKNSGNKNDNFANLEKINSKNNITTFFGDGTNYDPFERNNFSKRSKTIINQNKYNYVYDRLADPSNEINMFYIKYSNDILNSSEYNIKRKPIIYEADDLNSKYEKMAFLLLKENFYDLIKNLFQDNYNITKKYYTDLINKLLNLIKGKNEDLFKRQLAIEFLSYLMERSRNNIYSCAKSPLMEYIKSPQIFTASQRELHETRIIISNFAEEYKDILTDLINDMNDKNIFVKRSDEDKKKRLRRASFIIYSCDQNKFSKDFGLIRDKAKELLSDYSDNNLLEGEIFLIMRMLFLRFSHDGVQQMIRDLWPIIFTELIQNILEKDRNKDYNLYLESCKFVELLSLVNIEEFSLYQWIFMIDTYDMNDLDTRNEESLLKKIITNKEKIFKPLLFEIFGKNEINVNEMLLEGEKKGKSQLYIQAKNLDDLRRKIKQFLFSIGDMNSYKVEANYEQIEENIEKDFIEKENQGKKR